MELKNSTSRCYFICSFVFSFPQFSEAEVDITGVTEMSVNKSLYMIQDDSVVMQDDQNKYACSEKESDAAGSCCDSDSDESDSTIPIR